MCKKTRFQHRLVCLKADTNRTVIVHVISFRSFVHEASLSAAARRSRSLKAHKQKQRKFYNTTILYVRPHPSLASKRRSIWECSTTKLGISHHSESCSSMQSKTELNEMERLPKRQKFPRTKRNDIGKKFFDVYCNSCKRDCIDVNCTLTRL